MNRFLRLWALRFLVLALLPFSAAQACAASGEELTIVSGDSSHVFDIELALTMEEHARGLMFRKSMSEDAGMLFVFPDEAVRVFWMKDTLMPLDMLFIRKDGVVADIHENAVPFDTTRIVSASPASYVLEINGGMAAKLHIKPGDRVLNDRYFPVKLAE